MTEDSDWSIVTIEDFEPTPEELDNAFAELENNILPELNWKSPGRRAPEQMKEDTKTPDVVKCETPTKNLQFDFMDDVVSVPQMRVRNQNSALKGSAKKKTTNFAGVLDQMKKHGRLPPKESSPSSTS